MEVVSSVKATRQVKDSKLVDADKIRDLVETLFGNDARAIDPIGPIPFTYPFCWFKTPAIQSAIFDSIDLDRWMVFHEAQDFIYQSTFNRGARYDIEVTVVETEGPPRQLRISGSAVDDKGKEILRSRTILRVVELKRAFQPTTENPRADSPGPQDQLPVVGVYSTEAARISRYLAATGDDNPIHHDVAVARAAGLEGPIIPGMFILGQFERAIREWRPDAEIMRVNGRFLSPVCMPADLVIRRRLIRSAPSEGHIESVLRLCGGTLATPMACIADAIVRCAEE